MLTVEIYFPFVEFIKMYDSHKNVCGSSPVLFLCSRKPPKSVTQKNLRKIAPPNMSPQGLYLENCPEIQSKTKQKRSIYFQL